MMTWRAQPQDENSKIHQEWEGVMSIMCLRVSKHIKSASIQVWKWGTHDSVRSPFLHEAVALSQQDGARLCWIVMQETQVRQSGPLHAWSTPQSETRADGDKVHETETKRKWKNIKERITSCLINIGSWKQRINLQCVLMTGFLKFSWECFDAFIHVCVLDHQRSNLGSLDGVGLRNQESKNENEAPQSKNELEMKT